MAGLTRFRAALVVGVGVAGSLAAEPIQAPLLSVPLSKPADEPRPAGPPLTPGGNLMPQVPVPSTGIPIPAPLPPVPAPVAPAVDLLSLPKPVPVPSVPVPLAKPEQVAKPAPPANSAEPARPVSRTKPESPLRPTDTGLSVNSTWSGVPAPGPAAPAAPPPAPGVAPMTTPTSAAVFTAALGLALAAAPSAPAQDADAIASLKKTAEDIKADVKTMKAVVNGSESLNLKDGLIDRVKAIDAQMQALDKKLSAIESKLDQLTTRTAASSPLAGGTGTPGVPQPMAAAPTGPKGTVRVINEYAVEVSLLLNGRAYRLAAGETKSIDAPAGDYVYELLQSGAQSKPVTSQIKDGETVTLRIH